MFRQDLTEYSDSELSLLVFNDEYFYRMRSLPRQAFKSLLEESFIFNDEQWEELEQDLNDDEAENE